MKQSVRRMLAVGVALATSSAVPGIAQDFGAAVDRFLASQTLVLFAVESALAEPASFADYVPRELATAPERILVAEGLTVEYLARNIAWAADMFAYWPNDPGYTHLIFCIEQERSGVTPGGNGGLNASVQRVDVVTGEVEMILHGMSRCDGIRRTPWGTILATEEEPSGGRAYELIAPLTTTGHWVADRETGDVRDGLDSPVPSTTIVQRPDLPTMAWEGIAVLPSGVVIAGDELQPGSGGVIDSGGFLDGDGGAIYKFVPEFPAEPGVIIDDLSQSPLVSGSTFAMTISCVGPTNPSFPQYGQGCEVGTGAWVHVDPLEARRGAHSRGATGYHRPEDLHLDPLWKGEGVRFCWANTGRESAKDYGEVLCGVDENPLPEAPTPIFDPRSGHSYLGDGAEMTVVEANRFVEGDERFNSFDNLHFQPRSGHLYVIEDAQFGEVIGCLGDGADRDIKTDGCVSIASVVDPFAEPSGWEFDSTGRVAYVVIQHGEQPIELRDFVTNPVTGLTDDVLRVTGW